jgi:glucuronoarabinoxylan endo-1,4-beta-xylanase
MSMIISAWGASSRNPKRRQEGGPHRQEKVVAWRNRLVAFAGALVLLTQAPQALARKAVTATVNTSKVHQEIAGFGGSEAYFQAYLAHHPFKHEIYDALFGPENGLNIDFLRLQNSFRYQSSANFDPDTVDIVRNANSLRGNPITILMSSWSPPAKLKSNGSEKNGGTLIAKDGRYDYAGFAQYWEIAVLAYRAIGIDPTYVSIQNEPDMTTDYESCRFNPTEAPFNGDSFAGYDKAVDAVYAAFQKIPSPPHLLGPETTGIGYGTVQSFIRAQNPNHIYAIAHHLYTGGNKSEPDSYLPALQAVKNENPVRLRFQTEYYTADGLITAEMIHNSLVTEDVSLYLYWPLTWPGESGTLINIENPADQSKWKTPKGWSYTDGYYALKQFSYFIHAGYRRVDVDSSNDEVKISAYLSPNRDKLVVVALNPSPKASNAVKLNLQEFAHGQSRVYRTTFPNTLERFVLLGQLGADNVIALPPQSVVTVEITR